MPLRDHVGIDIVIPASVIGDPPLRITPIRSLEPNWCWAACGAMLHEFVLHVPKQPCEIVGLALHRDCCHGDPCSQDVAVGQVIHAYQTLGIRPTIHGSPLGFDGLRSQIKQRRSPVLVLWDIGFGARTHFVIVVDAYPREDGVSMVEYIDPASGLSGPLDFEALCRWDPAQRRWIDTWVGFEAT